MEETLTRRPQVILIGNGLIRSFGDSPTSWTDLLENLTTEKYKGKINPNGLPNTLQIILRTEGNVNNALDEHKEELKGNPVTPELHSRIDAIRKMNPDHILTTNYSYEIECALAGQKTLSDAKIARLQRHTSEVKKCEPQYMIHSYNEAAGIPVWHIHGEARKPKSIIVGHYWYGTLLTNYKKIMEDRKDRYAKDAENGIFTIKSWLDAFIMGDVYVLGFGYDVSELDLWWLLNRKLYEKSKSKGRMYYYSNQDDGSFDEKEELLKVCGAEVIHCSRLKMPETLSDSKYRDYADAAIMDIAERIKHADILHT